MLSTLHNLFFPHQRNNQKPKLLHLSSLTVLLFLVVGFQSALSWMIKVNPGVLGFAASIDPQELLELTNQERARFGLAPLKFNPALNKAARQKAALMFSFNCWSHVCHGQSPWDFFDKVDYQYLYAGENLARDFADSQSVVSAWMASPTHKENILNGRYEEIGFAVVDGVLDNEETTLVVQLFGTQGGVPAVVGEGQETSVYQEEEKRAVDWGRPAEVMAAQPGVVETPTFSSFLLTKWLAISLLVVLIVVLAIDTRLIYQRQTVRISGKNFVHLSFFIIILISILLSYQGQVL